MDRKSIRISILVLMVMATLPAFFGEGLLRAQEASVPSVSETPVAAIDNNRFEFQPVVEGTRIVHDFIIENKGTAPLQIERIITDCSCTTAEFGKRIPPGEKEKITITINTNGYAGKAFIREIKVLTNDPDHEILKIHVSGRIDKLAEIVPERVVLKGLAGKKIETTVSLIANKAYPFSVVNVRAAKNIEDKIEYSIKKDKKGYALTVKNIMNKRGKYGGYIILETDNPAKPMLRIMVMGEIAEME